MGSKDKNKGVDDGHGKRKKRERSVDQQTGGSRKSRRLDDDDQGRRRLREPSAALSRLARSVAPQRKRRTPLPVPVPVAKEPKASTSGSVPVRPVAAKTMPRPAIPAKAAPRSVAPSIPAKAAPRGRTRTALPTPVGKLEAPPDKPRPPKVKVEEDLPWEEEWTVGPTGTARAKKAAARARDQAKCSEKAETC